METDDNHDEEPAGLNLLAEKVMRQPINPSTVAYCPTMDLIALSTVDEQVHVYRLNGQRVFGVSNKRSGCRVERLHWKPNGPPNPSRVSPSASAH
jgi:anaphase-promoting complex subunit 4